MTRANICSASSPRTAVLRSDLANGPVIILDHRYPKPGTHGPTRREIDAAVRDVVAAKQVIVRQGAEWTRVERRPVGYALSDLNDRLITRPRRGSRGEGQ
jgi:hypothetical protein